MDVHSGCSFWIQNTFHKEPQGNKCNCLLITSKFCYHFEKRDSLKQQTVLKSKQEDTNLQYQPSWDSPITCFPEATLWSLLVVSSGIWTAFLNYRFTLLLLDLSFKAIICWPPNKADKDFTHRHSHISCLSFHNLGNLLFNGAYIILLFIFYFILCLDCKITILFMHNLLLLFNSTILA